MWQLNGRGWPNGVLCWMDLTRRARGARSSHVTVCCGEGGTRGGRKYLGTRQRVTPTSTGRGSAPDDEGGVEGRCHSFSAVQQSRQVTTGGSSAVGSDSDCEEKIANPYFLIDAQMKIMSLVHAVGGLL